MRKTTKFLFLCLIGFSTPLFASSKIKDCVARHEILSPRYRNVVSSSHLNGLLLVGKKATYQVESSSKKLKVVSEQSFESGKSKIICGSTAGNQNSAFSIYAPTLIDNRKHSDTNFSFWQFQITADESLFGIWNKKSRLLSQSKESWEEVLEKHGIQFQIYQLSKNLFEIHLQKYSEGSLEQLLIRYDVVTDL